MFFKFSKTAGLIIQIPFSKFTGSTAIYFQKSGIKTTDGIKAAGIRDFGDTYICGYQFSLCVGYSFFHNIFA